MVSLLSMRSVDQDVEVQLVALLSQLRYVRMAKACTVRSSLSVLFFWQTHRHSCPVRYKNACPLVDGGKD